MVKQAHGSGHFVTLGSQASTRLSRYSLVFGLGLAIFMAAFPSTSLAYALLRDKNNGNPTLWTVDEGSHPCGPSSILNQPPISPDWNPCYIHLTYLSGITGRQSWQDTAIQAKSQWTAYDATYSHYVYVYDDGCCEPQQVTMDTSDLGGPDINKVVVYGVTNYTHYAGNPNQLASSAITMSTDSYINWCTIDDVGCLDANHLMLEGAMDHELGHGIGLNHPVHDSNGGYVSVLECLRQNGESGLRTSDDLNGQMYLYSGHASDFGSPGSSPC